jgi:hypothetical protein
MHEVGFINFAKSVLKGLADAIRTDIDVFLMTFAGLLWPFKITKGLSISTFLYVITRRIDGPLKAFMTIKKEEVNNISEIAKKFSDV